MIVDFLRDNWQYISAGLVVLLEIVLILFKKRPLSLDNFDFVLGEMCRIMPIFVGMSENSDDKKNHCINLAINYVEQYLRRSITDHERVVITNIASPLIENILLTPTKKGGIGREKA